MTKRKRYGRINGKVLNKIKLNIRLSMIIFSIGLLLIALGFILFKIDTNHKDWSSTDGIITESKVLTSLRETKSGSLPVYELIVKYEYLVDGKSYVSDRIVSIGGFKSNDELVIRRKQQNYSVNSIVTVYYNRDEPNSAILEIENSLLSKKLFFIGGIISLFGLTILIVNLITERKLNR